MPNQNYDAIIVGAGPAGCAAALALSKYDLRIAVIEKMKFPIDKVCGQGVMPTGLSLLKELEVFESIDVNFCHPIDGIAIYRNELCAKSKFKEGQGLGIKRTALSEAFYKKIISNKQIDLWQNSEFKNFCVNNNQAIIKSQGKEITLSTKLLIGADGLRSGIRKIINCSNKKPADSRFAIAAHVHAKAWSNFVEIYLSDDSDAVEAYVTPSGKNLVNIVFMWRSHLKYNLGAELLFDKFLNKIPKLKFKLETIVLASRPRAIGPFKQLPIKISNHKNIVLIGDAAGYVDPLSGEGINLGMASAVSLADIFGPAIRNNSMSINHFREYNKTHKKLFSTHKLLTTLLLEASSRPWLINKVLKILEKRPAIFQRLLSLNMG